jgi:YD repeat-containing protein
MIKSIAVMIALSTTAQATPPKRPSQPVRPGMQNSRFYDAGGRLTGRATTQGRETRFYGPGNALVGKTVTQGRETRLYGPGGKLLGKAVR